MHDNGIMMLLYPCRLLFRLRQTIPVTDRDSILGSLNRMLVVLQTAGSTPLHKQGGEAATAAEHLARSLVEWQEERLQSGSSSLAPGALPTSAPFVPAGPVQGPNGWIEDPLAFDDTLASIYLDLFQQPSEFAFDPFLTF